MLILFCDVAINPPTQMERHCKSFNAVFEPFTHNEEKIYMTMSCSFLE